MTRYDPFAYGQVPLNQKEPANAAPDDMLFAAPASPRAGQGAAGSDWDPPAARFQESATVASGDDALAFGQDILGEAVPEAAAPARAASAKAPAAKSVAPAPAARPKAAPAAPVATAPAAAPARPELPASKPAVRRGPTPIPMAAHATTAGVASAATLVATGAATSAWFFVKMDNPVMGAIVAAAGLVGGAIAWLLLRR